MDDNTERQFRETDAAVDRAVAAFIIKINSMSTKWDAVSRQSIVERVLPRLCDEMGQADRSPGYIEARYGTGDDEAVQRAGGLPGYAVAESLADHHHAAAQDAAR